MAEYEVNEDTTAFLELRFKDERGQDVVPVSGTYRIDDTTTLDIETSGTEILGDTPFTPASNRYTITIDSELNHVINENNVWEDRQVTIQWSYFSATSALSIGTDVFNYTVKKLRTAGGNP